MENIELKWEEEFVEKGADLEHDRWSKWQKYLHSKCEKHPKAMMIPPTLWAHWERQIATKYADLSDREKESDRKEARAYLTLIRPLISEAYAQGAQDMLSRARKEVNEEFDKAPEEMEFEQLAQATKRLLAILEALTPTV